MNFMMWNVAGLNINFFQVIVDFFNKKKSFLTSTLWRVKKIKLLMQFAMVKTSFSFVLSNPFDVNVLIHFERSMIVVVV